MAFRVLIDCNCNLTFMILCASILFNGIDGDYDGLCIYWDPNLGTGSLIEGVEMRGT